MRKYEIHHRKSSFKEFRQLAYPHSLLSIIVWIPIKLGLFPRVHQSVVAADSIQDSFVELDSIPNTIRESIRKLRVESERLGFEEPTIELVSGDGINEQSYDASCLRSPHKNQKQMIQITVGCGANDSKLEKKELISFLNDGRIILTVAGRPTFDPAPWVEAEYYPEASLDAVCDIHAERIAKIDSEIMRIQNTDDLVLLVDKAINRFYKHMCKRGIYVEVE